MNERVHVHRSGWTLLTAPGWVGMCPPMPGRDGPTYATQIEAVSKWMSPATRNLYEALRWKENPRLIFDLYVIANTQERKPNR